MKKSLLIPCDSDKFFTLFANAVRLKRQEAGVTQLELISYLQEMGIKVSQAYLSQLEAGQRKEPSAKIVIALSAVLSINLNEIIKQAR